MSQDQIKQIIGQLESSIEKIEDFLTDEEFAEYCDSTYSSIAQWRLVLKRIKNEDDTEEKG